MTPDIEKSDFFATFFVFITCFYFQNQRYYLYYIGQQPNTYNYDRFL